MVVSMSNSRGARDSVRSTPGHLSGTVVECGCRRNLETKTAALLVVGRRYLLAFAGHLRRAADRRRGYDKLRPGNAGCLGSQSADGADANPTWPGVVVADSCCRRFRLFRYTRGAETVAINLDDFLLCHDRLHQSNPALKAGSLLYGSGWRTGAAQLGSTTLKFRERLRAYLSSKATSLQAIIRSLTILGPRCRRTDHT